MKRIIFLCIAVAGLFACGGGSSAVDTPVPTPAPIVPTSAELIYHMDGFVFVMNRDGSGVTQITSTTPRVWEHVALSANRRYVVGNVQAPNPTGVPGGFWELWLIDLETGTEARLLSNFESAGNGGVAWDDNQRIIFACRMTSPFSNPQNTAEFQANAGANDVCSTNIDGSDILLLIETPDSGEADVSNSEDGTMLAFVKQSVMEDFTEIWVSNSDGTGQSPVYVAGTAGIASAHDPEFSADNQRVIFSVVNSLVSPNFPADPNANTAHDIYSINLDGTDLRRLSMPGPISIIPDWKDNLIVYTDIGDFTGYIGASSIDPDLTDQQPLQIQAGATIVRWIR